MLKFLTEKLNKPTPQPEVSMLGGSAEYEDPQWRNSFLDALKEGAELSRAVVVKPLGQGFYTLDCEEKW